MVESLARNIGDGRDAHLEHLAQPKKAILPNKMHAFAPDKDHVLPCDTLGKAEV